ncbi:hypothetical protein EJ08DRAFT_596090 [Tothia fuscella]|uniref:Uncharacterized protein n=1 Tax=Tothia fuscella TaxID=1048955 RepID=A0A9P4NIN0_9PEZI|nr:hypothetical protein EJ08DRAFT_596090 [Tothia fuscella]
MPGLLAEEASPFWTPEFSISSSSSSGTIFKSPIQAQEEELPQQKERELSLFERVVTTHPPILESLLSQIPTRSIFNLHQSSRYLRQFLESYPLAWKALSFRLPQPAVFPGSPGIETPDRERQSKQYSLDALLISVVIPLATRLKSLDLCNTAVSGVALVSKVLQPRIGTLEHLSVRGCKNVSIKYHIVPFLQLHSPHQHPWVEKLGLKSLYTYRCRHHRRRPYLPSSLARRDSDSEPTHELIEICHQLGIWTDTAWCPTPGARCYRRKDYHGTRAAPGTLEVWVPFDRLWRSGNRLGSRDESHTGGKRRHGILWEDLEGGHDGEALGTDTDGEGKYLPAHLRRSHKIFVEDIKCDECGEAILERCETCSIKMHCMGCRKTLCGSCSFNRPIPRRRAKVRHFPTLLGNAGLPQSSLQFSYLNNSTPSTPSASQTRQAEGKRDNIKFWWAPGASRSPNLMNELPPGDDSDDDDDLQTNISHHQLPPAPSVPLKLDMYWCCIEPVFSGGGGVTFLGPSLHGPAHDLIRAVPLPKTRQYEDPDFVHTFTNVEAVAGLKNGRLYEEICGGEVDVQDLLVRDHLDLQERTCPRSLCTACWRGFRWKVNCRGCKRALCREHDFRNLKVRKCGYRDLGLEREFARNPPLVPRVQSRRRGFEDLRIPAWRGRAKEVTTAEEDDGGGEEMRRDFSDASSSAESSQLLLAPASSPTDRPSSINNFDMAPLSMNSSVSDLPLQSISRPRSSTSRQRSVSLSDLDRADATSGSGSCTPMPSSSSSSSSAMSQRRRAPMPCEPGHPVQWEGCGSYFCQQVRPVGDCRLRCSAVLRECGECAVLVCEFCIRTHTPLCTCSYCKSNYHCPTCATKSTVSARCRRDAEVRAVEEARERERKVKEKEMASREGADAIASSVGEFYASLAMVQLMDELQGLVADGGVDEGVVDELEDTEITSIGASVGGITVVEAMAAEVDEMMEQILEYQELAQGDV